MGRRMQQAGTQQEPTDPRGSVEEQAPRRRRLQRPPVEEQTLDGYEVVNTTVPGAEPRRRLRLPAGCLAAKDEEPACELCGARLSVTGVGTFYPCGHEDLARNGKPMAIGWRKRDDSLGQETIQKEPGHGQDPLKNDDGEVLFCEGCELPQFVASSGMTCANGHDGARGLTGVQLRARKHRDSKPAKHDNGDSFPASGFVHLGAKQEAPLEPVGATVTVQWGKELYSPKQFHTWEVGPFSATYAVHPGETIAQAMARGMEDLRKFAEQERERKRESYVKTAGIKA